jgi:membrane protease YdiL (CAAX protease family)
VVIIVLSPEWVRVDVSPQQALASVAYTMVGSFSEELVFRVMLLSYMASVMRSPLAGLIASSTIFGFIHVPFNLVDHGVFSFQLSEPQVTAVPLMQTALGCLCGIVWLRTRSLLLVGLVHAIVNVPPGLSEFSAVWN